MAGSNSYLLSIDQGTTSTRAILFSKSADIVAASQREFKQYYPEKGWVEHDPEEIWADCLQTCRDVLKKGGVAATEISGIGIANQRETSVVWDRDTGKPIYPAIVWQDRRTAGFCKSLKEAGHEDAFRQKTGLLLDPYFSGTKLRWILDHVEGARALAEAGKLAFGTIDCFLLWRLTGRKVHATDVTNAARTLLFNIETQDWDDELLSLLDIPRSLLPEVKDNAADFGQTEAAHFGVPIAIGGMAGDQHAAVVGQACFDVGQVKSTYGTGCFALLNIGSTLKRSENGLLTTPAYRLNGEIAYAIEGSIFIAGAAIQWLRDNLHFFEEAAQSEGLALTVSDNGGIYFVPAFTGLGAPYWDPLARGAIFGIGRETTKAHIARAALEAQAYQTHDLMDAMEKDSGKSINMLRADGGLVANAFMCRFLADTLNCPIEIPHVTETTALGVAYLAGLQQGVYQGLEEISQSWHARAAYYPNMSPKERKALLEGWQRAVQAVRTP